MTSFLGVATKGQLEQERASLQFVNHTDGWSNSCSASGNSFEVSIVDENELYSLENDFAVMEQLPLVAAVSSTMDVSAAVSLTMDVSELSWEGPMDTDLVKHVVLSFNIL